MEAPARVTVFDAFIFSGKAALAAVAAYLFYEHVLTIPGAIWAAVSALFVSQPTLHPSLRASLARCIANLIGAGFGSLCAVTLGPTAAGLAVGVIATGMVCHLARLDESLRSAYAAVAIVILSTSGPAPAIWIASLDRVAAVAVGCAVAVVISLIFDFWLAGPLDRLRGRVVTRTSDME
jgi:uncharacterized membrane protein YgaE (UPF0421/DUF939 family)